MRLRASLSYLDLAWKQKTNLSWSNTLSTSRPEKNDEFSAALLYLAVLIKNHFSSEIGQILNPRSHR